MALRVSLQIDGDASGARKALEETTVSATAMASALKESGGDLKKITPDMVGLDKAARGAAGGAGAVAVQTRAAAGAIDSANLPTTYLVRNFSELTSMLIAGQDPMRTFLTQGLQITRAFGPGAGVGATMRTLGGVLLQFVTSPLALTTVGLSLAAGAVGALFSALSGGEGAMERHSDLIGRIKEAWPAAAEGVREYARESIDVLRYLERRNVEAIERQLEAAARRVVDATREVREEIIAGFGHVPFLATAEVLEPFAVAIERLNEGIAAGRPDIVAYRREVAAIAEANPALRDLADGLLEASNEAETLQRALEGGSDAVRTIGAEMVAARAHASEFAAGLRELQGIAPVRLDDRTRALSAYKEALADARSPGQRAGAETEYLATLDRIAEAERLAAEEAAKRAVRGVAGSRTVQQALQADRREVEMLRAAQDAIVAQWDEMRSVASGVFGSIAGDIRQGASAGAILLNVVNRLADSMIRAGATAFANLLFGARGGAPGGLFGVSPANLFSVPASVGLYHEGGRVGATPPARRTVPAELFVGAPRLHDGYGLRQGEFPAILEEGETVIPKGRGGAGVVNNFYVSTPSPRAFAESRATVARAAGRLVARSGRHM